MITVYKYPLKMMVGLPQKIVIEGFGDFLCAKSQRDNVVVYAGVDTDKKDRTEVEFVITGTGVPFKNMNDYTYMNTVETHKGAFVWHVYFAKIRTMSIFE